MPDSGVWRDLWRVVQTQFPDAKLTSSYRSGSITSTGNLSWHARGNAIDISGPNMTGYFEWIKTNYGGQTAELIYTPAGNRQVKDGREHRFTGGTIAADHFDHVHWAMQSSPGAPSGGPTTPGTSSGNPLSDALAAITNPSTWVRVGAFLAAALVLFLVFAKIGKG